MPADLRQSRQALLTLPAPFNLAALGLLVWGILSTGQPETRHNEVALIVLLVVASLAWIVDLGLPGRAAPVSEQYGMPALVVMAGCGGVLSALVPLGAVYLGLASMIAWVRHPRRVAAAIACLGPVAMILSSLAFHSSAAAVLSAVAAALAGTLVGAGRRAAVERTQQTALLALASDRAEVEEGRAELLEERNRLAREIHDVLAHTLSALSVQVEALSATVADGSGNDGAVLEGLEKLRGLVRDGLNEARDAVRALRDDTSSIGEQLSRLCQERGAAFSVTGEIREVPPEVSLSLYRIAQESLTNALKHAPGSPASVKLEFAEATVVLVVENELVAVGASRPGSTDGSRNRPTASPATPIGSAATLSSSGGGYGLEGFRERMLLLGGRVEAGVVGGHWRVVAEVPA